MAPARPSSNQDLELLLEFVNTNDIEAGRDQLATPELLGAWLMSHAGGQAGAAASVDERTHERALALREGLRTLGRANNGETADPKLVRALQAATAELPLTASLGTGSAWTLRADASGPNAFLASIVATALRAMADGAWSRVKACQNDTCRWVFIDRSRNRSRTWCTMAICGSRMKARTYRARRRGEA